MFDVVLSRRKALLAALALGLATRAERVLAAIPRYAFSRSWGGSGTATGRFDGPRGVAVAGGRVYVADSYNNRIQVFNRRGRFLRSWGGRGSIHGKFSYPRGIATDRQGRVYVVDGGNHRFRCSTPGAGFFAAGAGREARTDRSAIHATSPSIGAAGSW